MCVDLGLVSYYQLEATSSEMNNCKRLWILSHQQKSPNKSQVDFQVEVFRVDAMSILSSTVNTWFRVGGSEQKGKKHLLSWSPWLYSHVELQQSPCQKKTKRKVTLTQDKREFDLNIVSKPWAYLSSTAWGASFGCDVMC